MTSRLTWIARLFVAAAALFASAAFSADARVGKFVKYDAGDFVIITSRSATQARDIMQKLVKFRVTLEKLLGRRAAKSGIGTHIIITSAGDWKKWLEPRERVAGYFQRGRFDNYMALDGDAGEFALYVMFHEYTHFYLSSQFAGEYPPWFNEGLAELMAYAKFGRDNQAVLQIPMFRLYEARDGGWMPFDKLIKIDYRSAEYQSHQLAKEFYAQSWLTVHYGMLEDREFGNRFMEYINAMNRLVPQAEASRAAFGDDLGAIDARLRAYSRKSNMFSGGLDLGAVPEFKLPEPQPLSEADGYAVLIDVMLASRRDKERIRPLIQALQKREPEAARTWILSARLAELEDDSAGFDSAVDKAGKLLTATDMAGHRDLGTVLLESAEGDYSPDNRTEEETQRVRKRALNHFASAVQLDPGDARALWGLGAVLTRLDQELDLAETALTTAYAKVPASAAISMSLAHLKGQQGKPEEMIRYLQDTIRIAPAIGMRRWATETLERTQEVLVEQKKVDEENRRQREQYEKDLAEYEKKYGKPKKKKTTR
jgi:tetratricopeptide (TPR) repeat protein